MGFWLLTGVKYFSAPQNIPMNSVLHPASYSICNGAPFPDDIRRGADKSLARPGRKQATATKLGIYPTYFPRSSIHFLVPCSHFWNPLKKIRILSVQPAFRGSNLPPRRTKNGELSTMEQAVVRWGQIRRIGWVIKTFEAQAGQFLLGCKCPVSRGIVQEQDPLGELPAAFFL
jgi:hypothetical protein